MVLAYLFFAVLALAAVAAAAGLLLSRNSVYGVLFLIVNFASVAILYLTLGAPFIALAQITVYAGAIMILFLFVIMLLGAEKMPVGEPLRWQRPLGIFLGVVLMLEAAYVIVFRSNLTSAVTAPAADYASPAAIGLELFNNYLLPFEVTSILLLVAVVGAIVLTGTKFTTLERHLVTPQARAAGPEPVDLLGYEKQIQASEEHGNYADPDSGDMRRADDASRHD